MKIVAILSILLQLWFAIPLFFFLSSIAAVPELFNSGNANSLAGHISTALIKYILGGAIPLVGLLLNAWVNRTYVSTTFFSWSIWSARLMCLYFPIGTIVGYRRVRQIKAQSVNHDQRPPNE